jgi:hypothetical protein
MDRVGVFGCISIESRWFLHLQGDRDRHLKGGWPNGLG